jgi:DsbC/DsbD-like thiol-disulfide interchange protein
MKSFSFSKHSAVLFAAAVLSPISAQKIDYNSLRSVVRLSAPEAVAATRKQTVTFDVVATLKPGYHVASNVAPAYPLKVALVDSPAAELQNVAYPSPKSHKLGEETLSVFDGEFRLKLTLKVPPTAPVGRTMMTGKVSYQACDDRTCLRPETMELKFPLDIRN